MVEVDEVPAGKKFVDGLLVEGQPAATGHSPRGPCSGGRRSPCRRPPVVFRLPLQVWNWWMLPSGSTRPLQPRTRACKLPGVILLQHRGELQGAEGDVESGLFGHALDHSPTRRCCGRWSPSARTRTRPPAGGGEELLGLGHVAGRALPGLVVEGADRGDGGAPGVYCPSHATWFSTSRSMDNSRASRTRGSFGERGPRSTGGVFLPFLLPRLMVIPL